MYVYDEHVETAQVDEDIGEYLITGEGELKVIPHPPIIYSGRPYSIYMGRPSEIY